MIHNFFHLMKIYFVPSSNQSLFREDNGSYGSDHKIILLIFVRFIIVKMSREGVKKLTESAKRIVRRTYFGMLN